MGFKRLIQKNFAKTRFYLGELKESIDIQNEYDGEKLSYLEQRIKLQLRKRIIISNFRLLLMFLIYAGILSTVVYVSPLFFEIVQQAVLISGVIGVTVLLFMVAVLDFLKAKVDEEIVLLSAHIIAIYNANDQEEAP